MGTELKRKWKIYVIQHAHTDIGYTQRQEKITRYYQDFIRQAMQILDNAHSGKNKEDEGFKWQCENHWQVEVFWQTATTEEKKKFCQYVKSGEIGLSGNFLNLCELIDWDVLDYHMEAARVFGEQIGYPIHSAMTADINGYAWGYADALYNHGFKNFFSCLHSHHGLAVTEKKQRPFLWESPQGNQLLVWMGDHYNLGNDLMLSPHTRLSYLFEDKYSYDMEHRLFREDAGTTDRQELEIAEYRVRNYLENLEKEKYPWDYVPIMVSGAMTDNACPNAMIPGRLRQLNEIFTGQVEFQMATLDDFFAEVEKDKDTFPVFRGDWPDWWSEGAGSTPGVVKLMRSAQRKYHICRKLDREQQLGDKALMDEAARNIMLYAEHTWGYSASITEPWSTMVNELDLRNASYAVQADTAASKNLDLILSKKGESSIAVGRPLRYKVVNPHERAITEVAALYVDSWEYIDGTAFDPLASYEVYDEKTGEVFACQCELEARGYRLEVQLVLAAGEERMLRVRKARQTKLETTVNTEIVNGTDRVKDVIIANMAEMPFYVENEIFAVTIEEKKGIVSVVDKKDRKELLRSDALPLFTAVYEVTPFGNENVKSVRSKMGRNRKSIATNRFVAELTDSKVVMSGPLYTALELTYQLEGTRFFQIYVKIYKNLPRIEATVRVHKESVWEPENLYLALPFGLKNEVKYIDKTGCILRPGIDQLPGSNQEFYMLQNGLSIHGEDKTVVIGSKDVPLVVFGDLKAKPVRLCDGKNEELNRSVCYSWMMNNYWETNFKAETGGFYEFTYSVDLLEKTEPKEALEFCAERNEGILVLRMGN